MQRSAALTLFLALILVAPTAIGTWYAYGSYEPDTTFDEQDGYMWLDPNEEQLDKAYLNVIPIQRTTWTNPNLGATGSRILIPGSTGFDAFFGTWVDCNGDNYIGHAESVLIEYPARLLPEDSICHDTAMKAYNQQDWVAELRWISNGLEGYGGFDGNNDGIPDGRDGRAIRDLGASVWGDFGTPGDTMGREICPRDIPRNGTQRTGVFLNWADCFAAHRGWATADATGDSIGMGFERHEDFDQAGHPVNQETLGEDNGDRTMITAWDCTTPRERYNTGVRDANSGRYNVTPTGVSDNAIHVPWVVVTEDDGDLNLSVNTATTVNGVYSEETLGFGNVTVAGQRIHNGAGHFAPEQPRPVGSPGVQQGGTVAGTINHTVYSPATQGDCTETAGDPYPLESNSLGESKNYKNRVTMHFAYYEEQRSGRARSGMAFYGAQVYPVVRGGILVSGTTWYSETSAPSELGETGPTPPQFVRSDLQPEGAVYWTFYANLTAALTVVTLPPSSPGTYGTDWCGSSTSGLVDGFECDRTKWYLQADGTPLANREFYPRPGHPYHLRDVDCYDGSVMRGTSVYASLVEFSEEGPCADASTVS